MLMCLQTACLCALWPLALGMPHFGKRCHAWNALQIKYFGPQAEEAREKAATAAAEAAALAGQAKALGREAKIGRELRDENYRLEEALQK